jgi:hypothetical protein
VCERSGSTSVERTKELELVVGEGRAARGADGRVQRGMATGVSISGCSAKRSPSSPSSTTR